MDGAKVKDGPSVLIQFDDSGDAGKTAPEGAPEGAMTVSFTDFWGEHSDAAKIVAEKEAEKIAGDGRALATWSLGAGLVGFVVWFFVDIPTGWDIALFSCSLLLTLNGGAFWRLMAQVKKEGRHATSRLLIAMETVQRVAEKAADAEDCHKAQLTKVKAEKERLCADMCEEMKDRESEAAKQYSELEGEKRGMERENKKLTLTLNAARETLSYYADRAQVDVYEGEDALYDGEEEDTSWNSEPKPRKRECSGVYVINNAADGKVKIGHTGNFAERFFDIQSKAASSGIKKDDIVPVVFVPVDEGRYEIEQEIHAALDESRHAGEWFKIPPEEAVAVVVAHVHKRRVSNFKERTKIRVPKGGEE